VLHLLEECLYIFCSICTNGLQYQNPSTHGITSSQPNYFTQFDQNHPQSQTQSFDLNTTYLRVRGNDIQSYTQLLTCPYLKSFPISYTWQHEKLVLSYYSRKSNIKLSYDVVSENIFINEYEILFQQPDNEEENLNLWPIVNNNTCKIISSMKKIINNNKTNSIVFITYFIFFLSSGNRRKNYLKNQIISKIIKIP